MQFNLNTVPNKEIFMPSLQFWFLMQVTSQWGMGSKDRRVFGNKYLYLGTYSESLSSIILLYDRQAYLSTMKHLYFKQEVISMPNTNWILYILTVV